MCRRGKDFLHKKRPQWCYIARETREGIEVTGNNHKYTPVCIHECYEGFCICTAHVIISAGF